MKNETPEDVAAHWFAMIQADNVIFTSADMKMAFLSGWHNAVERCKDVWDEAYAAGRAAKEVEDDTQGT